VSNRKSKNKVVSHTSSHKKVIINLELAEKVLSKELFNQLNELLIELNHFQETVLRCSDELE
jgi:hypothetical protein